MQWSHERDPENTNVKHVHIHPTLELSDHTRAYNWNREKFENKARCVKGMVFNDYTIFYSKSSIGRYYDGELTDEHLRDYIQLQSSKAYKSLDDFFGVILGIVATRVLTLPQVPDDVYKSHCSCVSFFKHHKCKHVFAISSRILLPTKKALFVFRQDCKNIEIGKKRKRGRPGHAVKALLRQDQRKRKEPETEEVVTSTNAIEPLQQQAKKRGRKPNAVVPVEEPRVDVAASTSASANIESLKSIAKKRGPKPKSTKILVQDDEEVTPIMKSSIIIMKRVTRSQKTV